MSRRSFVLAGGSGLAVTFGGMLGTVVETVFAPPAGATGTPNIAVRLVRPSDQLDIVLELFDVALDNATGMLNSAGPDPRMRIDLGSQHTAEDAFVDPLTTPPATAAAAAQAAGSSRLVTSLATPIPFAVDRLLDASTWSLRSPTSAGPPVGDDTAIELPTGLIIAPGVAPTVTTSGAPRTVENVTELWRVDIADPAGAPLDILAVENVNAADVVAHPVPTAVQRNEIVANTTAVAPAQAERLTLSRHGAFAELGGTWEGQTVSHWRQSVVTGRDVVAEVVQEGFLMPFGHRAKILEVNSRRFVPDTAGNPTAVLSFERFLAIDESDVIFDSIDGTPSDPGMEHRRDGGRGLPFSKVTIAPTEWIPIGESPISDDAGDIPGVVDLIPDGASSPLELVFTAVDRAGNAGIGFSTPATFVEATKAFSKGANSPLGRLSSLFNDDPDWAARRSIDLDGQSVAFTDEVAPGSGATTYETNTIDLKLAFGRGLKAEFDAANRVAMFPAMSVANIVDDSVGNVDVTLHPRWLDFGLGTDNFDLAILALAETVESAIGGAGRAVAAVDFIADVFNQTTGAGLDLPSPDDPWTAEDALGAASALLGFIPLADIIPDINLADAIPGIDIPGVSIEALPDKITTTFTFTPEITSVEPLGFIVPEGARAEIENVTCVPFDGQPENTLTIAVDDVTLLIPPVVTLVELDFSRIEVIESSVDGLTVDPQLRGWTWGSSLDWLSPLSEFLDKLGDGGINVTTEALELAHDFTLPPINFGVASVTNANIVTSLDLPFIGGNSPSAGVGLGSVAKPVEISVLSFGATFYLEVDVSPGSPGGLRRLAAGVSLVADLFGIDIVVAEANVSLRLGADFTYKADKGIVVSGFIAIEGNIEVLGLVSVSAELIGSLTYREARQDLKVSGRIEWAVETFLGGPSGSIPLGEMRYELGDGSGGAAAPAALTSAATTHNDSTRSARSTAAAAPSTSASFGDRFTISEWRDEYVAAFA